MNETESTGAERGRVLLALARESLSEAFGAAAAEAPGGRRRDEPWPGWLREPGATFVTLHKQGALRGCVGTIHAHRPLGDDVRANARAAAFADTRFPPLAAAELPQVEIEVSLLSAPEPLPAAASQEEILRLLRPGIDGIILEHGEHGEHRSTFLPQVWEQLRDPAEFMAQLKRKAGLPAGFWSPDLKLWRYGVTLWEE